MNKIKVIDLLNMISKGKEVPKKIKFYGKYYIWYDNRYTGNKGYCLEPLKSDSNSFLEINTVYDLNKEVEIIEEEKKIPEKLDEYIYTDSLNYNQCNYMFENLTNKINEICDYIDYQTQTINELIEKENKLEV